MITIKRTQTNKDYNTGYESEFSYTFEEDELTIDIMRYHFDRILETLGYVLPREDINGKEELNHSEEL